MLVSADGGSLPHPLVFPGGFSAELSVRAVVPPARAFVVPKLLLPPRLRPLGLVEPPAFRLPPVTSRGAPPLAVCPLVARTPPVPTSISVLCLAPEPLPRVVLEFPPVVPLARLPPRSVAFSAAVPPALGVVAAFAPDLSPLTLEPPSDWVELLGAPPAAVDTEPPLPSSCEVTVPALDCSVDEHPTAKRQARVATLDVETGFMGWSASVRARASSAWLADDGCR